MNALTVKELQTIAKAEGIVLSYTVDGKRKKLNKAELIAAIEAVQAEKAEQAEHMQEAEATVNGELEQYWETLNQTASMTVDEMADAVKEYETELLSKRKRTITINLIVARPPTIKPIIISGENIKLTRMSNADQVAHA